jgi:hypothetical protein
MSSVALESFVGMAGSGIPPDMDSLLGLLGKESTGLFCELEKALKLNK